jgi:ABC-type phosphate transport system substrate-binding protein
MKRRTILLALSSLLLWQGASSAGEDVIIVIANKDVPQQKLGRDELRPIFQVTKLQWPNGNNVVPLNLPEDNSLRKGFDSAVLGLDPDRVARYWIDRKIRGDARPPKKLSSPAAVVKAVAKTSGAIGYVAVGDVDASVKVVAKIKGGSVIAP